MLDRVHQLVADQATCPDRGSDRATPSIRARCERVEFGLRPPRPEVVIDARQRQTEHSRLRLRDPLETVDWSDLAVWGVLGFQVFLVVIFGYGVWYSMMRRFSVNQVMPFTLLVPVFGVLSSVALLDERLTWPMVVGGIATLIGVGICVLRRPTVVADATKGDSM